MKAAIKFENISKQYRLGAGQETLRELLSAVPRRLIGIGNSGSENHKHLWALRSVTFELERGKVLGIIGSNGAGKTTILKLVSRVTKQSTGRMETSGRVSALIELGAGFHPDLTGRENIYLNGVILGSSRKEVEEKFDRIVAFAELEEFIDTPVKRYSSGMYARLGFSVAAHSDPDILLVDEVLAVGDAAFQRRSYDFVHSFVTGGNTAVFVSHNLYVIEQLCDRVLWLEEGQIVMAGNPEEVLNAYLDRMDQRAVVSENIHTQDDGHLRIERVSFADIQGNERDTFATGEDIVINLRYRTEDKIMKPHFHLGVKGSLDGQSLFLASMLIDGNTPPAIEGHGTLKCRFKSVPLMPRAYHLWGEVWGADQSKRLLKWRPLATFRIANGSDAERRTLHRGGITRQRVDAPLRVPYQWEF